MNTVSALSNIMPPYKLMMCILPAELAALSSPVTLIWQPMKSIGFVVALCIWSSGDELG